MPSLEIKPNSWRSARAASTACSHEDRSPPARSALARITCPRNCCFRRSPVTSIDYRADRLDSFLILAVFDLNVRSPDQCLLDLYTEYSGIVLPETMDHLVVGFQRVLQPVQIAEDSSSVHEGARNPLKESRGLAFPETTDHLVADLQRVLRSVQRAEDGPFVHEGGRNRIKKGRRSRSPRNDGPPRHRLPARPAAGSDCRETAPLLHEGARNRIKKSRRSHSPPKRRTTSP